MAFEHHFLEFVIDIFRRGVFIGVYLVDHDTLFCFNFLFWEYRACGKSNLDKCIEATYKELRKLQEEPLSDRKLKAAKKQLLGQIAISGDNGETQCLSMGKSLLAYGKINGTKETRELIENISAADIQEMACTVFNTTKLSKLIYI